MRNSRLDWCRLVCGAVALLVAQAVRAEPADSVGWRRDLDRLLAAPVGSAEQQELLSRVVDSAPGWVELVEALRSPAAAPRPALEALPADSSVSTGGLLASTITCRDGATRPYIVYVPASYSPGRPAPLLVVLHGGVSRPALRPEPLAYAGRSPFLPLAEMTGSLALFPFGQAGCTWWDECGMGMIAGEIEAVKRGFNVDSNRVTMCGFSDGASAGFLHAMLLPDAYSSFVCLNGHMGVGSLDGGLPTYAPNLANRPVYAVTTFDDPLYPSAAMRPTIAMAQGCGADIAYRELPGLHEFSYADTELPRIARWLAAHPRDAAPRRVVWETALPQFGRCAWLEIASVTPAAPALWYADHNCVLVDTAITFGFNNDQEFAGPGISVSNVLPDSTAAAMGLQAGDVIMACPTGEITGMDSLAAYKTTLRRGGSIALTVQRDGAEVQLTGQMAPPENYYVFKRDKPSALVEASFSANRFVLRTSRTGMLRLWLNPDLVDFDQPVTVEVNGALHFEGMVQRDVRLLLEQHLAWRDPAVLYGAVVELDLAVTAR